MDNNRMMNNNRMMIAALTAMALGFANMGQVVRERPSARLLPSGRNGKGSEYRADEEGRQDAEL